MEQLLANIQESTAFIKKQITSLPKIGLILGSGLGELADEIENPVKIPYEEIPHFPTSTVEGHDGQLVIGELEGKSVVAMQGRFHYYEGYSMQEVTFPIRVMKELGIELLIITNAAGSMNKNISPGDFMIIRDHINMTGQNPLIGKNIDELGPRFPDMSQAYTKQYIPFIEEISEKLNINVQQGVYVGITGPTYCSAAELIMLRKLGGDAVGMSTVPEVIVASHAGLKVIGISCITDMAIGEEIQGITHEEVVAVANEAKPKFKQLMREIMASIQL